MLNKSVVAFSVRFVSLGFFCFFVFFNRELSVGFCSLGDY